MLRQLTKKSGKKTISIIKLNSLDDCLRIVENSSSLSLEGTIMLVIRRSSGFVKLSELCSTSLWTHLKRNYVPITFGKKG